ncbi:MAG: OmpA family protein [Bacteroidales bacterium]|nr:OmpA family protein [Bacteroidales bacterium]
MKTKLLPVLLLFMIPLLSFAQDDNNSKKEKYAVITNGFWDNWFISAGAGAQVYLGDSDGEKSGTFGKRIAPAIDIAIGKWFTPGLGLRLTYSGLQGRGFGYKGFEEHLTNPYENSSLYRQKWNMMNLHGDIMFNLTNMFCGYKENRVYSAIPYIGFGWLRSYQAPKTNNLSGNIGLINTFRVSKALDINLEARACITKDNFDTKIGGIRADAITGITAGITYRFKQRNFKKASCAQKVAASYENQANELDRLQQQLKQQQAYNKQLENELAKERNKKPEVKVEKEVSISPRTIFFNINQATVSNKEKINLKYLAEQIKENPKKTFTIEGYADSATGSAAFNKKVSEKRAQNVYDVLVKDYNVNPQQLKIEAKGGTSNMFGSNALNRVVIVK